MPKKPRGYVDMIAMDGASHPGSRYLSRRYVDKPTNSFMPSDPMYGVKLNHWLVFISLKRPRNIHLSKQDPTYP